MTNYLEILSDAEIFAVVDSLTREYGQDTSVISAHLGIKEADAQELLNSFYGELKEIDAVELANRFYGESKTGEVDHE